MTAVIISTILNSCKTAIIHVAKINSCIAVTIHSANINFCMTGTIHLFIPPEYNIKFSFQSKFYKSVALPWNDWSEFSEKNVGETGDN
jgi:hypothetical protein